MWDFDFVGKIILIGQENKQLNKPTFERSFSIALTYFFALI